MGNDNKQQVIKAVIQLENADSIEVLKTVAEKKQDEKQPALTMVDDMEPTKGMKADVPVSLYQRLASYKITHNAKYNAMIIEALNDWCKKKGI